MGEVKTCGNCHGLIPENSGGAVMFAFKNPNYPARMKLFCSPACAIAVAKELVFALETVKKMVDGEESRN